MQVLVNEGSLEWLRLPMTWTCLGSSVVPYSSLTLFFKQTLFLWTLKDHSEASLWEEPCFDFLSLLFIANFKHSVL